MNIKMKYMFGFINDLEKIIYGMGFKLTRKKKNNDRAFYRVNGGAGTVAKDCNTEITDVAWCVDCIDPSNEIRIIIQKGLSKKSNIDFSFRETRTYYKNVPDAANLFCDIGVESGFEIHQYFILT